MNNILKTLYSLISAKNFAKFQREAIDPNPLYGFPLMVSESLCLIQTFTDFAFDGFSLIRIADITTLRSDENERFDERVLKGEGLKRLKAPLNCLDSWRVVLEELQSQGKNIIIESEKDHEFNIGKVVSIGEEAVSFLYFDHLGNWDEEPFDISYEDITLMVFDRPYIEIISKYLKS